MIFSNHEVVVYGAFKGESSFSLPSQNQWPQRDDRVRNILNINSHQCPIIILFSTPMIIFTLTVLAILVGSLVVEQVQCARTVKNKTSRSVVNDVQHHCFPAVGFKMPNTTPTSLTNWWCNTDTEYAFVGFSYDISSCDFLRDRCFL